MFVEFLRRLLGEGTVVLSAPPALSDANRAGATAVLSAAFADHVLDVAGPPVTFDAPAALAAAEFVGKACWFLVSRDEPPNAVEQALKMPRPGETPGWHLSADVVLRFLPAVYRRARALSPDDVLTRSLEARLREWPLAGVLSEVNASPVTAPTFGGHPGLLLLFAERLAEHVKPAWVPDGPGRAYVEMVFAERGLRVPVAAGQGVAVER
jgi:hypothetical protein